MTEEFITINDDMLPEVEDLYKRAFGKAPWNDDWSDGAQLSEYIRDVSGGRGSLNYGLLIDGKLAAVSLGLIRHWWEGTNYNIEELCVDPDLQGQGIGTRFMHMIEEDIKAKGLAGIFLQTDSDKPSYGFYLKNGYKELGEHVSFYKRVKD
jgi:aminoglycoside 6'-N-acetyltransferase I